MKLIKILEINVKLIEEVESYSFFRWINKNIYRLSYRQKSKLRHKNTHFQTSMISFYEYINK